MDTNIIIGRSKVSSSADGINYLAILNIGVTQYIDGGIYQIQIPSTNINTTPRLNINGIGNKFIYSNSANINQDPISIGQLVANKWYFFMYDLNNFDGFILLNTPNDFVRTYEILAKQTGAANAQQTILKNTTDAFFVFNKVSAGVYDLACSKPILADVKVTVQCSPNMNQSVSFMSYQITNASTIRFITFNAAGVAADGLMNSPNSRASILINIYSS